MENWGPELAIILGFVEGLTEYLPVSSTGHLILVGHFLGFTGETAKTVDIAIQLGAVLAIVVYERAKLVSLFTEAFREQAAFRPFLLANRFPEAGRPPLSWSELLRDSFSAHPNMWFLIGLGVAFFPAAVVGLLSHQWIKDHLFNPQTVAGALIVGGIIILIVESFHSKKKFFHLHDIKIPTALWVGIAQCFALFPGVSRSGATIIGGLLAGLDRKVATEYSFFLALPTMIAATSYQMIKARSLFTAEDLLSLALGLLISFLVAWMVIAGLLAFVKNHSLRVFGYYRIVLGILVLLVF